MERRYIVSRDVKSGLWYAHKRGFTYIPVSGSLSERKLEAEEYAKMMDCLPNRVQQIEDRRKAEFEREYCDGG